MMIHDFAAFSTVRETGLAKLLPGKPRITVGMGTCGSGNGAEAVFSAFASQIDGGGLDVHLVPVGCFGFCAEEPLVGVWVPGRPLLMLHRVQPAHVPSILNGLVAQAQLPPDEIVLCKIEEWDHITGHVKYGTGYPDVPNWNEIPFFRGQLKLILRNCGLINPDDIEEYFAVGGYQALYQVLIDQNPVGVIEQLKAAKLRGRGGAGFSAGNKWEFLRNARGTEKYLICNADEGDPGAYMNRNEIESDPYALLEGMTIGGYVTGATTGIIYVRAEYPVAVLRLERAIERAREYGLLGKNVLGRGFDFDIELVEGAGAFVCGEETALMASLENKPGRPRPRPPFPAEKGVWGKPTNINNVETWYNVAPIVSKGAAWYAAIGTAKSAGTKVFSLVGKVHSTGLVELPLGTPISRLVYDIGEGGTNGRDIKAVQTGGPSGGCIPVEMFDTPIDYENLAQLSSIMGSGGVVVMDEDNCMVDTARYFTELNHSESCGRCVPCRVGLDQSLRILNRITSGDATIDDLATLDELCRMTREMSLCQLGMAAPNPVLTTLRHYRHEFEDHIRARRCRAGVCEDLALSPCENSCPLHMNIPRFLQLYKEGRLDDAFMSVILDNPLPASTGRVCQQPCDDRCRRANLDESVNMRDVHRLIADEILLSDRFDEMAAKVVARKMSPTGCTVGIVGSGPAGLACAYYMALLGHTVTVYDARPKAGGMLRYSLPEYRLPKKVVDREIDLIERLGVDFKLGVTAGRDISLDELGEAHDVVFLAVGTWKESTISLPGIELTGVYSALAFLEAVEHKEQLSVGSRVVVIGGGNAAIDSARTARRLGASATVVYRRERNDMPAIAEEVQAAEHEGVELLFLAAPHRLVGDANGRVKALEAVKTRLGEFDTSGRRKPVATDEVVRVDCDTVILAVGEKVESGFCAAAGVKLTENGAIETDRYTLQTSRERFYAGGDAITGATNVSNAMGIGKKAARLIDAQLMGRERIADLIPEFEYGMTAPDNPVESPRHSPAELPSVKRVQSYTEVSLGLTPVAARDETTRCLRCDLRSLEN